MPNNRIRLKPKQPRTPKTAHEAAVAEFKHLKKRHPENEFVAPLEAMENEIAAYRLKALFYNFCLGVSLIAASLAWLSCLVTSSPATLPLGLTLVFAYSAVTLAAKLPVNVVNPFRVMIYFKERAFKAMLTQFQQNPNPPTPSFYTPPPQPQRKQAKDTRSVHFAEGPSYVQLRDTQANAGTQTPSSSP